MRDGYGTETWPSGTKYEGNYKNDVWHGGGKYVRFSQPEVGEEGWLVTEYEGQFENGERHGKGKQIEYSKDGIQKRHFSGHFVKDQMHGAGTMLYTHGDKYEG